MAVKYTDANTMRNTALKIWEYRAKLWQHHRRDLQIKYPHKYKLQDLEQKARCRCKIVTQIKRKAGSLLLLRIGATILMQKPAADSFIPIIHLPCKKSP